MDAADLFRQAQSSVNRAREAKSFRRESSHESDDHSPRIAHTLTACCRCRQVRVAMAQVPMPRVCTDYCNSGRQDAILTSQNVCPVSGLVPCANTSTRQRERKYLVLM